MNLNGSSLLIGLKPLNQPEPVFGDVLCVCAGGPEEARARQLHLLSSHQTRSEDHQIPAAAQGNVFTKLVHPPAGENRAFVSMAFKFRGRKT